MADGARGAWLRALAECADGKGCGVQTLGAALLAGHCAGDVRERSRLSAIDARWRRDARQRVSAQEWRRQLDDAGIGAGLEPGHGHLDARRPQGQLRRMDAAHEGGPDGAGLSGEAALDSVAYQVMGALGEALGSFSALAPAAASWAGRPPCAC